MRGSWLLQYAASINLRNVEVCGEDGGAAFLEILVEPPHHFAVATRVQQFKVPEGEKKLAPLQPCAYLP